jgi:hypothetical protein
VRLPPGIYLLVYSKMAAKKNTGWCGSGHEIAGRKTPNDVFITPPNLAKIAIDLIDNIDPSILWLDPFKATGNYYNQFPTDNKDWCEITENKDFFCYQRDTTQELICCSNPPYSLINPILKKLIELQPITINLLIGINNLTTKRMEMMENAGYYINKLLFCKVHKWFGMSVIVNWIKSDSKPLTELCYNRKIWR